MKFYLFVGLAFAALATSCSTISHTSQTVGVDSNVYNLTVADMDVDKQKVSTTVDWKWTPLSTVSIETQKENAAAELMKQTKADVVVEPQYTVKRRGLFRGGSVTITGYPARYSNFRTMSKEDAEKIAVLDGKVALVCPMIGTSGMSGRKVARARIGQAVTIDNSKHKFLNLIGGLIFDTEDHGMNTGGQAGLMYGSYGHSWGWYIKGVWMYASATNCVPYPYHREGKGVKNGGALTAGAIKTIGSNWNAFVGAGFGTNFAMDDGYGYRRLDLYPALATELGFQWISGSFNVLAGVDVMTNFDDYTASRCNINPFVGVGFSF